MARSIVVNFGGKVSTFGLSKVDREKLYGKRTRVVVDEDGNPCTMATLTRDGTALLPPGSVAMLYMNDDFEVCERSELQAVSADGEIADEVESTLGAEVELRGPVPASRVLDHLAKSVYILDPEELDATLQAALEAGQIFETRFNYRKGFDENTLFLLKNEEGFFGIVAELAEFEFLYRNQAPSAEDEDAEDPFEDDDLDFSMF